MSFNFAPKIIYVTYVYMLHILIRILQDTKYEICIKIKYLTSKNVIEMDMIIRLSVKKGYVKVIQYYIKLFTFGWLFTYYSNN